MTLYIQSELYVTALHTGKAITITENKTKFHFFANLSKNSLKRHNGGSLACQLESDYSTLSGSVYATKMKLPNGSPLTNVSAFTKRLHKTDK